MHDLTLMIVECEIKNAPMNVAHGQIESLKQIQMADFDVFKLD